MEGIDGLALWTGIQGYGHGRLAVLGGVTDNLLCWYLLLSTCIQSRPRAEQSLSQYEPSDCDSRTSPDTIITHLSRIHL